MKTMLQGNDVDSQSGNKRAEKDNRIHCLASRNEFYKDRSSNKVVPPLNFDQKSYFFIRPSFLEVGTRVTLLQKWCFFSSLPYLLSMNSTRYYPECSTRCFNLVSGLCPSPAIPEGVGKPDRMDRHPLCQLHYNDQTGEVYYQWTNTKFTK